MTKNMASVLITSALMAAQGIAQTPAAPASDFAAAQKQFDTLCAGCHGEGAKGGDRAPGLVNKSQLAHPERSANPGVDQERDSGRHARV